MVEKLKGPEKVIVFSSCPCAWKEYQPETRNLLLEQVKNGKGLVYTGAWIGRANFLVSEGVVASVALGEPVGEFSRMPPWPAHAWLIESMMSTS